MLIVWGEHDQVFPAAGVRYSDPGPFRAISWRALQSLRMEDQNFGWTVEMQIKAAIARLRTVEFPVPGLDHGFGQWMFFGVVYSEGRG